MVCRCGWPSCPAHGGRFGCDPHALHCHPRALPLRWGTCLAHCQARETSDWDVGSGHCKRKTNSYPHLSPSAQTTKVLSLYAPVLLHKPRLVSNLILLPLPHWLGINFQKGTELLLESHSSLELLKFPSSERQASVGSWSP